MTTPHLTDNDLVLHYYGEMASPDEAAAAAHLAACAGCRRELATLQRVLGAVDDAGMEPFEAPPGFERTAWARLEPSLRRERRGWISWLVMSPAPLALAAAVILLVGVSFLAGRMFPTAPDGGGSAATGRSADQIRERILLVDLGDHLDRSQMVLVELVSAPAEGDVDISAERARAEQLVADNRLYRQTALQAGEGAVSDLLDELERVLVDVAASPEHLSSQELDEVRRRIESRGLLFKVRVVSSEVRERQQGAERNAGT
jgi:hypothetical protein